MNAATLWRWLRSELLGLAVVGFVMLGLPYFFDPLTHVYLTDVLRFVALWFVIALVRTGFGVWWRRRGLPNRYGSDDATLGHDQA